MDKEYRAQFAFVALGCTVLGSAITFGFDRLNNVKPVIISDAINAVPQPAAIVPTAGDNGIGSDALVSQNAVADAPSQSPVGLTKRKRSRASHKKITSGVIHINSATLDELEELPGVGPSTAQAIIDFRTQAGGFSSPDELGDIPRMGKKKLAKMMPFVAL